MDLRPGESFRDLHLHVIVSSSAQAGLRVRRVARRGDLQTLRPMLAKSRLHEICRLVRKRYGVQAFLFAAFRK